MAAGGTEDGVRARGVLNGRTALERFQVVRHAPPDDLAPLVGFFWILTWDLRGHEPHRQQVLTDPSVHVSFTTGGRARVVGVVRDVFTETIAGRGRVVGARFRAGGFRPFLDAPMSTLTGRKVPVEEIFGPLSRADADAIIAAPEPGAAVAMLRDLLRSRAPDRLDPAIAEIAEVMHRIAGDPTIVRVGTLAADAGVGTRRLQRLFADYVGVGPKWVIRRYRMQEAADRAAEGTDVDWAGLAADLGYADQAHLTRDFTTTIGVSPTRYAQACRTGA